MKKIILVVLLSLVVSSSAAFAAGNVKWYKLKDGIVKAKAEKKPLLVDFFYGKGCPRCEMLEKNVYSDPQIAKKINDDFIPVLIDLTKPLAPEEEELGNKYDYKNDCLMLFLDHDMKALQDPAGKKMCFADYIEPAVFINYLDTIKKQRKD